MPVLQGDIIKIRVVKGNELVAMDLNGTSDPYVLISSALNYYDQIKTEKVSNTLNPVWSSDEEYSFKSPKDNADGWVVKFRVMDYDRMKKDDFLGDCELLINDDQFKPNQEEQLVTIKLQNIKKGTLTVGVSLKRSASLSSNNLMEGFHSETWQHDPNYFRVDSFKYMAFSVPKRFTFDNMNKKGKTISFLHQHSNKTDYEYLALSSADLLSEMSLDKAKLYYILSLKKSHKEYSKLSGNELTVVSDDVNVTSQFKGLNSVFKWEWIFVDHPDVRKTRVVVFLILPKPDSQNLVTVTYKTTLTDQPEKQDEELKKIVQSIEKVASH